MIRRLGIAFVMAALLASCSGGQTPPQEAAGQAAPSSDAGGSTTSSSTPAASSAEQPAAKSNGSNAPAKSPTSSAAPATSTTVAGATTGRSEPEVKGSLPFSATISPSCAKRGQTVLVDVTTRPHASIAAGGEYADGEAHGMFNVGNADASGKWLWRILVPPDAPYGDVRVDMVAQDRTPGPGPYEASTNGDTTTWVHRFKVAKSCG